jgi:hypothetical protein
MDDATRRWAASAPFHSCDNENGPSGDSRNSRQSHTEMLANMYGTS